MALWLSVGLAGGAEAQVCPVESASAVLSKCLFPLSFSGRWKDECCYVYRPPPVLPWEWKFIPTRLGLSDLTVTVEQCGALLHL